MRATLLLLILANLVFFAWSRFIDVPAGPPPNDSLGHLPRLELMSRSQSRPAAAAEPAPAASVASTSESQKPAPGAGQPAATPHPTSSTDPTRREAGGERSAVE